jgi:hypothetical protein
MGRRFYACPNKGIFAQDMRIFCILVLMTLSITAFSQKSLQITFTRFGKLKKYEIPLGQSLEYKLKGQHTFHKNRITNLQDSLIVLSHDSVLTLSQIKKIRIRHHNYHNKLFRTIFTLGAVGYPLLNIVNNALNSNSPLLDQKAMIVSASFLSALLITREMGITRLRITKNKTLKVVDVDYNKLNAK